MNLKGQLDGYFAVNTALRLNVGDVLIRPARQILGVQVTVLTNQGIETFDAHEALRLFRPWEPGRIEECVQCGADPGHPCEPGCLGLALIDDASTTVFGVEVEP